MFERRDRLPAGVLLGAAWLALLLGAGCRGGGHHGEAPARRSGPSVIPIELSAAWGEPERPLVEFDHEEHTGALGGRESCDQCHEVIKGRLVPRIKGSDQIVDLDSAMEIYHEECLGCHEQRGAEGQETGPGACGECHRVRSPAERERQPLRFDLSLHQRHVQAEGERGCGACHHAADEATGELVPQVDEGAPCSDCHEEQERQVELGGREVRLASLRDASHVACLTCHRDRSAENRESGPLLCEGCHDDAAQRAIERLEDPPRLKMKGQPNRVWLLAEGGTAKLVAFDHEGHERHVDRCSTCHHQSMSKCSECHTLTGRAEGGQVTLEQAFHQPSSGRSCVGCHQQRTMADQDCAGCHQALGTPPSEAACAACHSGPPPQLARLTEPAVPSPPGALPELPPASEDFPTTVTIDSMSHEYGPAKLPHRAIVEALARGQLRDRLAASFHGGQAVPCAGCHHHGPDAGRPPPCRACHGRTADPRRDQPGLLAAYHRQCLGCHQQMGIEERGCTDCHEPAREERERGGER